MSFEEKLNLITRNLEEIIGLENIKEIIQTRPLKIYWGTATTGKPHLAYLLPLLKIRDFLLAGCEVTILLADIHAFLDNLKAPIDLIEQRTEYYNLLIQTILKVLKIEVKIVKGSNFQKKEDYYLDLLKLTSITNYSNAKRAGTDVVKQLDNPTLSSLIYPLMQSLDEEYLNCDVQFGGLDQRKIFTYSMKYLPQINYKKRSYFMNPMIEGLNKVKMSSSDPFSKIELCESKLVIEKKIKKCFLEEKNSNSGVFSIIKHIILPFFSIFNKKMEVIDFNYQKYFYSDFEELKKDYESGVIHPMDLKNALVEAIEFVVQPIREEMMKNVELIEKAYPETK